MGDGSGAEEKAVMLEGKVFVRRMSMYCEETVEAFMAAREPYDVFLEEEVGLDFVMLFASSFSTVMFVKYGDVKP